VITDKDDKRAFRPPNVRKRIGFVISACVRAKSLAFHPIAWVAFNIILPNGKKRRLA